MKRSQHTRGLLHITEQHIIHWHQEEAKHLVIITICILWSVPRWLTPIMIHSANKFICYKATGPAEGTSLASQHGTLTRDWQHEHSFSWMASWTSWQGTATVHVHSADCQRSVRHRKTADTRLSPCIITQLKVNGLWGLMAQLICDCHCVRSVNWRSTVCEASWDS